MYDVNGLPSTVMSTRRCASCGVTFTSAALETLPTASTAANTTPTPFLISGAASLLLYPEALLLQVALADLPRFLRRARLVGDRVQLHDRPPLETHPLQRREHAGQVHPAPAQLHEAIGARGIGPGSRGHGLNVLEVEEQEAVVVAIDGLHRVASTLRVMGDVQL